MLKNALVAVRLTSGGQVSELKIFPLSLWRYLNRKGSMTSPKNDTKDICSKKSLTNQRVTLMRPRPFKLSLTINVPLILKVREVIFFAAKHICFAREEEIYPRTFKISGTLIVKLVKHIMGYFEGFFETFFDP
jgi:hypothetical protein